MWFDPYAALAKIEMEAGPPATSATSATPRPKSAPKSSNVAIVADVAALPTPKEAVVLLPGTCAECGGLDDGSTSVVIMAMLPDKPWRHSACYSAAYLECADSVA